MEEVVPPSSALERVTPTEFPRENALRPVLTPPPATHPARRAGRSPRAGWWRPVTWSFVSKPHAELFGGGGARNSPSSIHRLRPRDMRPACCPASSARVRPMRTGLRMWRCSGGTGFAGDRPQDQRQQASASAAPPRARAAPAATGTAKAESVTPPSTPRPMRLAGSPPAARRRRTSRTRAMRRAGITPAARRVPPRPERDRHLRRTATPRCWKRSMWLAPWWRSRSRWTAFPSPRPSQPR